MAANTVGLVLGGISVATLFNTVESCIRGYDRFVSSTRYVPDRLKRFAIDVQIEQRKFLLYWRYMRLSTSECPLLQEQSANTQELILNVTSEILSLLTDGKRLANEYGVEVVDQNPSDLGLQNWSTSRGNSTNAASSAILRRISEMESDTLLSQNLSSVALTTSQNFRWNWKDQDRAKELLDKLRKYNEDLWTSLAPHHEILLRCGEPSFVLPNVNDLRMLQILAQRSESSPASGILAACSDLRQKAINSRSSHQNQISMVAESEVTNRKKDSNTGKGTTQFRGDSVIIEYKIIDSALPHKDQEIIRNRLRSLMHLLSQNHHPTFRILQGVGLFQDPVDRSCYGLMLRAPQLAVDDIVTFHTLGSLLRNQDTFRRYSLGQRFKLALSLATAVLHLHAAEWFHKGLCLDAILFQQSGQGYADITEPKMAGFEFSRPSKIEEASLEPVHGDYIDYFKHPDRQVRGPPRYQASHDYFSLGMCLFCIGVWRTTTKYEAKFKREMGANVNAQAWAAFMRRRAPEWLRPICGDLYSEAVSTCLSDRFPSTACSGNLGQELNIQMAFFTEVVQKLAECRI